MIKILIPFLFLFTFSQAQTDKSLRRQLQRGVAKCQVAANVTCNVIGSNIPCSKVVTPSNACGPTAVRYSFKYINQNSNAILLNYTKFWAIMDGSNRRDKMDTSPMKPGETRFYVFNHTLNTCSVGTFGQIKVEGLLNVSTYNYCYAYDFIPNLVGTIASPTSQPTNAPSPKPTAAPISRPTFSPTPLPTLSPTPKPTNKPTSAPISKPTLKPNFRPTVKPNVVPSPSSTVTLKPTRAQVPTSNDVSRAPTKRAPASSPVKSPASSPVKSPVSSPVKKPSRSAKAP